MIVDMMGTGSAGLPRVGLDIPTNIFEEGAAIGMVASQPAKDVL
jgi:hypothetical protein